MKQLVDARGLACPEPVVRAGKAMAVADEVTTIVDDKAAVENITRLARSKGFSIEVTDRTDGTYLVLRREGAVAEPITEADAVACCSVGSSSGQTVVFVPSDCLGRGSVELGERLIAAFFHTLLEVSPKPQAIVFMNSGVKLTVEGSRALEDLRALKEQGIDILSCGACLGYFELMDKLAVGRVSNMYDIAELLLKAKKIVEL
jgi:selenium metabolism protein YedF